MTRIGQMLVAYEQKYDLSAQSVAKAIGVHDSTYCRIKQGKLPDAINAAKIISWMFEAPKE